MGCEVLYDCFLHRCKETCCLPEKDEKKRVSDIHRDLQSNSHELSQELPHAARAKNLRAGYMSQLVVPTCFVSATESRPMTSMAATESCLSL